MRSLDPTTNRRRRLWMLRLTSIAVMSATTVALALPPARPALAERLWRNRQEPDHRWEAEPHLVFGPGLPPGPGRGSGAGVGFRGSFVVAPDGIIDAFPDSVAIGLGVDLLRYRSFGPPHGACVRRVSAPAGTNVCVEVDGPGAARTYLLLPIVVQWNIWLTPRWAVFGEPGLAFYATRGGAGAAPTLSLGGRLRILDNLAVTLRLGWPTVTIGASFFL